GVGTRQISGDCAVGHGEDSRVVDAASVSVAEFTTRVISQDRGVVDSHRSRIVDTAPASTKGRAEVAHTAIRNNAIVEGKRPRILDATPWCARAKTPGFNLT